MSDVADLSVTGQLETIISKGLPYYQTQHRYSALQTIHLQATSTCLGAGD